MDHRTKLLVMNVDTPDDLISEAAEAAAKSQDHLTCLLLEASPALPIYAYGALPYGGMNIPDNWNELVMEARKTVEDRAQSVGQLLARSNASGDVQSMLSPTIEVKHNVARSARVSDEVSIASNLRDTPNILREAAYGVLFHSPTGLYLNGPAEQKIERVFLAWDSSEAASSAAHAALPYLKEAKEVVIGCIDPISREDRDGGDPGTDAAAWLSYHGCNITVSQFPSGGAGIARCICDRAAEFGADLVVLGAYGHSRTREAVFGGTTRDMMEQTKQPIFMAH